MGLRAWAVGPFKNYDNSLYTTYIIDIYYLNNL